MGYTRTTIRSDSGNGRPLVRVEGLSHMTLPREGTPAQVEVRFSSQETPAGEVLEFETATPAMQIRGHAVRNQMQLTIASKGKTETAALPWSPEHRGFCGLQQSLWQSPMKPGQRRSLTALDPTLGLAVTTEMVARDYEPTGMPAGSQKLLRVDTVTKVQDQVLPGTMWLDDRGEVLKTRAEVMNKPVETFRATKELALAEIGPVKLDLVRDVSVPVDRVLERPHETRRVRYRIHMEGGDPAAVFVSGISQQVKSIDPHTAEVTVYAVRPDNSGNPDAKDDPPREADRRPSSLVQSDHPKIIAAAERAAAGAKAPWQTAVALERFVHEAITDKDYTQAFDSAVDALESGRGDCTEHAVLLAALCRARAIPARTAMGLVYRKGQFLYHMWTEAYLSGRWVPLDATLARGGIGAAHLKVAHSSLESTSAYASLLPVAQVAGKLKIEILDVE